MPLLRYSPAKEVSGVFSKIIDFLLGCLLGLRKRKWI